MKTRRLPRVAAGALLVAAACGPDATAPEPATPESPSMEAPALRLDASPEQRAMIGAALTDFRTRIAPTLGDDARTLVTIAQRLEAALDRGDAAATKQALVAARATSAAVRTHLTDGSTELDVLDIVLDIADATLPHAHRSRLMER